MEPSIDLVRFLRTASLGVLGGMISAVTTGLSCEKAYSSFDPAFNPVIPPGYAILNLRIAIFANLWVFGIALTAPSVRSSSCVQ